MDEESEENILVGVFLGTYSIEKLPVGFLDYNFDTINDSANDGYSEELRKDSKRMKSFRESIAIFALAKTVAFVLELQAVKVSGGVGMTYTKYKEEAKKILEKYSKTWLDVEAETAKLQALSASSTYELMNDINVKYLEYRSRRDNKVRPLHRIFDGTVKLKTSSWWINHTPPLDFLCRCFIVPFIDALPERFNIMAIARQLSNPVIAPSAWHTGNIFNISKKNNYYKVLYKNKKRVGFSSASKLYKILKAWQ